MTANVQIGSKLNKCCRVHIWCMLMQALVVVPGFAACITNAVQRLVIERCKDN